MNYGVIIFILFLLFSFHEIFFGLAEVDGRDAAWQAGMQAAAMGITLAIAIPGGLATGTRW